jgi:NAD dependent epimerase/dehydratase family enzyme
MGNYTPQNLREMRWVTFKMKFETKLGDGEQLMKFIASDDFPKKFTEFIESKGHVSVMMSMTFSSDLPMNSH